jgi:hypothetical protein
MYDDMILFVQNKCSVQKGADMTLEQLGREYLRQAEDIKEMINGYSALKKGTCGIELYELNTRLTVLREMERDTRIT